MSAEQRYFPTSNKMPLECNLKLSERWIAKPSCLNRIPDLTDWSVINLKKGPVFSDTPVWSDTQDPDTPVCPDTQVYLSNQPSALNQMVHLIKLVRTLQSVKTPKWARNYIGIVKNLQTDQKVHTLHSVILHSPYFEGLLEFCDLDWPGPKLDNSWLE